MKILPLLATLGILLSGCITNSLIVSTSHDPNDPPPVQEGVTYSLPTQFVTINYKRAPTDAKKAKKAMDDATTKHTTALTAKTAKDKEIADLAELIKNMDSSATGAAAAKAAAEAKMVRLKAERVGLTTKLNTTAKDKEAAITQFLLVASGTTGVTESLVIKPTPPQCPMEQRPLPLV